MIVYWCIMHYYDITTVFLKFIVILLFPNNKEIVSNFMSWNLKILKGLKIHHVSYLYYCQPLPCSPNSKNIAQAVDDADRSPGINKTLSVFYCLILRNIR